MLYIHGWDHQASHKFNHHLQTEWLEGHLMICVCVFADQNPIEIIRRAVDSGAVNLPCKQKLAGQLRSAVDVDTKFQRQINEYVYCIAEVNYVADHMSSYSLIDAQDIAARQELANSIQ